MGFSFIGAGGKALGRALLADLHALHMHFNPVQRAARILLQDERDLVDQVLGHRVDIGAVLDDDVQRHVHAGVGGGDRHAAAQAAGGQDLGDPVGSGRCGHADDAVALERGVADHVGQDIVGNVEVAGNGIVHGVPFWLAYAGSKLLLAV